MIIIWKFIKIKGGRAMECRGARVCRSWGFGYAVAAPKGCAPERNGRSVHTDLDLKRGPRANKGQVLAHFEIWKPEATETRGKDMRPSFAYDGFEAKITLIHLLPQLRVWYPSDVTSSRALRLPLDGGCGEREDNPRGLIEEDDYCLLSAQWLNFSEGLVKDNPAFCLRLDAGPLRRWNTRYRGTGVPAVLIWSNWLHLECTQWINISHSSTFFVFRSVFIDYIWIHGGWGSLLITRASWGFEPHNLPLRHRLWEWCEVVPTRGLSFFLPPWPLDKENALLMGFALKIPT